MRQVVYSTVIRNISNQMRKSLANKVLNDSRIYVPRDTGRLEASGYITKDSRYIIYETPYARYQWYGKLMLTRDGRAWARRGERKYLANRNLNYNRSKNPKAGAMWVKRCVDDNKQTWIRELQEEV